MGSEPPFPASGTEPGGTPPRGSAGERRMVQLLLLTGLLLAAALIAVGLALAALHGRLVTHPVAVRELPGLLRAGRPSGFMALGILVLLATPILRVLSLIGGFALERDWRFAAVALGVALLLGAGILLGHA
jgi:uncharacterized membrane protein